VILLGALVFGVGGVEMNLDLDPASIERLAIMVGVIVLVVIVVTVLAVLLVQSVRTRAAAIWDQTEIQFNETINIILSG